jgi:hypothetical protein
MGDEDRADGSRAAAHLGEDEQESARSTGTGRRPLASLLAEAGVASEEQLRLAVAEGMGSGERLAEIVLRRGWIDEVGLAARRSSDLREARAARCDGIDAGGARIGQLDRTTRRERGATP